MHAIGTTELKGGSRIVTVDKFGIRKPLTYQTSYSRIKQKPPAGWPSVTASVTARSAGTEPRFCSDSSDIPRCAWHFWRAIFRMQLARRRLSQELTTHDSWPAQCNAAIISPTDRPQSQRYRIGYQCAISQTIMFGFEYRKPSCC